MKKFTTVALSLLLASVTVAQQAAVTDLPDISVIGNFQSSHSDNENSFDVKEIEFAFQHYLYPSVKADIFTALHKDSSGERHFELEEAYITFSDFFGVLAPNSTKEYGVGAVVGKKLVGIGKVNPTHPEQWQFVDRPLIVKNFFGAEEGLSAEGGQMNYLLPTSFFSQLELGYWKAAAHEEEGEEHSGVEYEDNLVTARLWNAYSLSDDKELEVGLNYLQGNAAASSSDDKQDVVGLDVTYKLELSPSKFVAVQSEYYSATYGEEGESRESQSGFFVSGLYDINSHYQVGLRFDSLGMHGDEGSDTSQWSIVGSRKLTDTSKLRLQYSTGDGVSDTILAQFVFGMGPHSHVLQ